MTIELRGTKIVEVPYFASHLENIINSILVVGERHGSEGIGNTIHEMGYKNVVTTDISDRLLNSWLNVNTHWEHITSDFVMFDETRKFDRIVAVSVFEHFGLWFEGNRMVVDGIEAKDVCRWNHDILGIKKACNLLKNESSKLIITLPAGPFMNYEENGAPWLRYYDWRRQNLIRNELNLLGYYISNETFFYSSDFVDWKEVGREINDPKNYPMHNPYSPNVIWGLTIQKRPNIN